MIRPTISVIIPVHYRDNNYPKCLLSLSKTEPLPDEIIIVVDGDNSGSLTAGIELDATVLGTPSSRGPAGARNLGAKKAHA